MAIDLEAVKAWAASTRAEIRSDTPEAPGPWWGWLAEGCDHIEALITEVQRLRDDVKERERKD